MGYRIRFDNGHEVEFESKPSDADIDEAYQATSKLPKPSSGTPGIMDMAGGVLESLTTGAVDALGGLGSQVYGSVKGALTPGMTASQGMEEALQGYGDSTFHKLMEPQTETGKYIGDKIGEVVSGVKEAAADKAEETAAKWESPIMKAVTRGTFAALSTAPEFLMIAGAGKIGRSKEVPIGKPKGADVHGAMQDIIKPEGGADRPPLPETIPVTPEGQGVLSPQDAFFKMKAEMEANIAKAAKHGGEAGMEVQPGDPFAQMKSQLGVPQRIPETTPAMAEMARRLQGEQPSPLRQQMELPFEQRPLLALESEGQMAPKPEPKPVAGPQGEMFGPLMDLESKGAMAPKPKVEPFKGTQPDMFGPDLPLDPNAAMPKLPKDSLYEQMRREARDRAVEMDERVQRSEQRLSKAEEAYIKASIDVQEGRLNPAHLERIERDLTALQSANEYIRNRVAEELKMVARKEAAITNAGPLSRQRGAVDIGPLKEALDKAVEKLKEFDIPIIRGALEKYEITKNPKDFADAQKAMKDANINGPASKALDDAFVAASNKTLGEMENMLEKKAQRKPPGPRPGWKGPKNQRGALIFDSSKQRALQNLASKADIEVKLQEMAPSQWTVAEALEHIKKSNDLNQNVFSNMINYATKGGQYLALKTHNPMIRFVVERFIDADRLARADNAEWIHAKETGLSARMRALSNKDLADTWAVVSFADLHQRTLDPIKLAERGFSKEQLDLIQKHRESMDYAFDMVNKARAAAGEDPITRRTAYAAMQATGDYRSLVYDQKGGNIVGVISSDFRPRLNRLKGKMVERGYYVEKERYFGGLPDRSSANEAFMRAIEGFAEKDPRVAEFVKILDEIRKTEINNFLNMKKHTMNKKGVFGMEGRKDWESAYQNALDGFKAQVNYLEGAIKWGHLAEAFKDSKEVLKSKDASHMPKAKEWSEKYMYNALGFNPSATGRAIEKAFAKAFEKMGVGFSVGREVMANARFYTNTMLLTMRPSFWAQNVIQPFQSMPGMKADLIARGLDAGFDLGTGYAYVAKGANTAIRVRNSEVLTGFDAEALQYARKKHVYGSDLIEHSNHIRQGAGYLVEKMNNFFAGNIESATRQVMFYTFAHMLKDNGMSVKNGLFEAAHNLTDITMNNYSAIERPQMYNVAGPAGDLAVNLQSYKHNELSRVAMFVRDSKEFKSLRPVAADMLSRFAYGGLMGLIAYNEADAMVHFVSKLMGHPTSLSNIVYDISARANKMVGGNQPYLISNGIPSIFGLDMSRSLGLTDVVPDTLGEALFPGGSKIAEGVGSAVDFAKNPTEMNAKRAAYANAPLAAQGALNNEWFTRGEGDKRVALRPRDLRAQAHRSDADMYKKALGFTGINESAERQKNYNVERISRDYADLRQSPLNNMRDSLFAKGKLDPKDVSKYVQYRGNIETLDGDIQRYATEQRLTPDEIAYLRAEASSSIGALKKAQDYLKAYQK